MILAGNLKTDRSLLVKLHKSAARHLTEIELRKQRISFVMGSVSGLEREQVEKILAKHEGRVEP